MPVGDWSSLGTPMPTLRRACAWQQACEICQEQHRSSAAIADWVQDGLALGDEVIADGLACFRAVEEVDCSHQATILKERLRRMHLRSQAGACFEARGAYRLTKLAFRESVVTRATWLLESIYVAVTPASALCLASFTFCLRRRLHPNAAGTAAKGSGPGTSAWVM